MTQPVAVTELAPRPQVRGKFLFVGNQKLFIRGVTYGTFRPGETGSEFHNSDLVNRDFATMAASGINAVRTYTVPPRWLLDAAQRHGLYVMVGLPWEQHVAFLQDDGLARQIEERVREGARSCSGHPAVLFFAIGNEIPTPIVRWHGARRIERFLKRLFDAVKSEDPQALVTYVNYPSTEYLDLPFLDLACFNVYLESQDRLEAYLARLQNLSGDRPLVMAEIGLDSRRNGVEEQARVLAWQIRTVFEAGCSGLFVFAWTDEWFRGGADIEDWDFGITDRERRPKPAFWAVQRAFAEVPFPADVLWPHISVVICSYNGSRTIADTCEGLQQLHYPAFEVIVVDDGSQDETGAIAAKYGFRVIRTENSGLSAARNVGWRAATGEIIAFLDDDARPDPDWLTYLASTFVKTSHVGVGGPNLPPPGDGVTADCVANAPGGPVHVLLADQEAEHIPGCNSAFRRDALLAVGGFDPRYRAAGDDVDICWRLHERGWTLGFNPAAIVWHHRRNSIRSYWKQQVGYGKAEALLEQKWPEKYNVLGHYSWGGRLYGQGWALPLSWRKSRIYHGSWGSAPFQSVYEPAHGMIASLTMMPEWYLILTVLAALSALGSLWRPLLLVLPILVLGVIVLLLQATLGGARATFANPVHRRRDAILLHSLTALLHLLQPLARLRGRLHSGLTPWRQRGPTVLLLPRPREVSTWREYVLPSQGWLAALAATLRETGGVVRAGGDYDRWDLDIRGGIFGGSRLCMVIEEHGASKQLIRFRIWPRVSAVAFTVLFTVAVLMTGAYTSDVAPVAALLTALAALVGLRTYWECSTSMATTMSPFERDGMELDLPFHFPASEPSDSLPGESAEESALPLPANQTAVQPGD